MGFPRSAERTPPAGAQTPDTGAKRQRLNTSMRPVLDAEKLPHAVD
jgi:hypothetical protein